MLQEYSIKSDGEAFIKCYDEDAHKTTASNVPIMKSIAGKSVASVKVLSPEDSTPAGCAVFAVSASAAVFVSVAGRVDMATEIQKAETKLKKAVDSAAKQKKLLDSPDFEKASEAVREIERRKLIDLEAERENFEKSIEQFKAMSLQD